MRTRLWAVCAAVALVGCGSGRDRDRELPDEADALIDLLREPANKVRVVGHIVPGGEMLEYSPPMKKLISLGDPARPVLHRRLAEEAVRNEVALVLGAVGDDETVPRLIDAYPDGPLPAAPADSLAPDSGRLRHVCFAHALTSLTHEGISRSRWGTDFSPGNRKKWQDWWAANRKVFWVTGEPGGAGPVPTYPRSARTLKTVPEILAQLTVALKDDDADVRARAATRLGRLGAAAVPALIAALENTDPEVRDAAAGAFYGMGPAAAAAVDPLRTALGDARRNVRYSAAHSLGAIGPAARAAVPDLIKALADGEDLVRSSAGYALKQIDPAAADRAGVR